MVWSSPLGYETREIINNWDAVLVKEQKNRSIKMFLGSGSFVMYFEFEGNIYACNENSRVTYSKIIKPNEEGDESWGKEATMTAFNLSNAVRGKPAQEIFDYEDMKNISVISKDEAYNKLVELAEDAKQSEMTSGMKGIFQMLKGIKK